MPARRPVLLSVLAIAGAALGAGCSSSKGAGGDTRLCADYKTVVDTLLTPASRSTKTQPAASLSAARKTIDTAWKAIATETADEPIASLAPVVAAMSASLTTALLDAWGADGSPLLATTDAADTLPEPYVARNGLKVDDQTTASYSEFSNYVNRLHGVLTERCLDAPGGWREPVENAKSVPAGKVLVIERNNELVTSSSAGSTTPGATTTEPESDVQAVFSLHEVDTTSRRDRGPIRVDGQSQISNPALSYDRKRLLVTVSDDTGVAHAVGSSDGTGFRQVLAEAEPLTCAAWSSDDQSLIVNVKTATSSWVTARVNLTTGRATALSNPSPWRTAKCVSADTGTQLLAVAPTNTGDVAVWALNSDGTGERIIASLDSCNLAAPTVSPDNKTVLAVAACPDRYRSGLYSFGVDGTGFKQILGGRVAVPSWSPDGTWIAFGYVPLTGDGDQPSTWIASADMTKFKRIAESWSSFPVWRE